MIQLGHYVYTLKPLMQPKPNRCRDILLPQLSLSLMKNPMNNRSRIASGALLLSRTIPGRRAMHLGRVMKVHLGRGWKSFAAQFLP